MRNITPLLLAFFLYGQLPAQLLSPDAFLDYTAGTRYTSHWRIVDYARHVAEQAPKRVKYLQYGVTHEGRPLVALFISMEENIANLENIRKQNLQRANVVHTGPGPGNAVSRVNASSGKPLAGSDPLGEGNSATPALLWLSYNIHGNEPSSSETSMQVLYTLAAATDTRVRQWLKNTVVIIDPCLNPDGRERYINWFNSVVGKKPDPAMYTREHQEPWPGGRSNHYNYDLNRDWAWQTQEESQQRMKLYLQWLPQVHVDFHEQGVDEPYYFAPAAQPYHEVITPWQREFQDSIGKNNARYFDEKGWLYFTRDVFDLYYPSYGDTYPLYYGAIGMTYEQGGGPRGGLAALTDNGDTLTLGDRIRHHYTTSLSTLELTSAHASRLIREFSDYFSTVATKGAAGYKSFVIKYDSSRVEQLAALRELLDKNGISYGSGKGKAIGVSYDSGREERFTIDKSDLVITTFQPRGTMVKVLFEPRGLLTDSLTYDITAWAIPYVYGLSAYAAKEKIAVTGPFIGEDIRNVPDKNAYGYIVKWQGIKSAGVLAELLKMRIKVRVSEEPFELGGRRYERGSLLVLKTGNALSGASLWGNLAAICNTQGVKMYPVKTGFVDKGNDFGSRWVLPVKTPKVALLTGKGVNASAFGEVWHFFEQELNYPVNLVNAASLGAVDWNEINTLILPDGKYAFLEDKEQVEELEAWINKGGKLIALEGAVNQLAELDWGLKRKNGEGAKHKDKEEQEPDERLKKYQTRERDQITETTPGAIYKVQLDHSHPLAYGYPDYYYTLKTGKDVYEYLDKGGWNVGVIGKNSQMAGFVGASLKNKFRDGLLFGALNKGKGSIIILAEDPLFRSFWENGKLLFANAVFFTGQ